MTDKYIMVTMIYCTHTTPQPPKLQLPSWIMAKLAMKPFQYVIVVQKNCQTQ